jgi:hypothetical protein
MKHNWRGDGKDNIKTIELKGCSIYLGNRARMRLADSFGDLCIYLLGSKVPKHDGAQPVFINLNYNKIKQLREHLNKWLEHHKGLKGED